MATGKGDTFQHRGIVPKDLPIPPSRVRTELTNGAAFGQYLAIVILGLLAIALLVPTYFGFPFFAWIAFVCCVLFLWVVAILKLWQRACLWIELHDRTIRAKRFLFPTPIEFSVDNIQDIKTMLNESSAPPLLDWLTGGRVRGFILSFVDGTIPMTVCRADPKMTNAKEFMEAVVYRMAERGNLTAEVVNLEGSPLVTRIYFEKT